VLASRGVVLWTKRVHVDVYFNVYHGSQNHDQDRTDPKKQTGD